MVHWQYLFYARGCHTSYFIPIDILLGTAHLILLDLLKLFIDLLNSLDLHGFVVLLGPSEDDLEVAVLVLLGDGRRLLSDERSLGGLLFGVALVSHLVTLDQLLGDYLSV